MTIHLGLGLPRQLPEAPNLERGCWWNHFWIEHDGTIGSLIEQKLLGKHFTGKVLDNTRPNMACVLHITVVYHIYIVFFLKPATSRRITSILIAFGEGWQGQYQRATLSNAVAFKAMAFTLGTPMASCWFLGFRIQRVKWGNSGSCILCLKAGSLSQSLAKVPLARRGSRHMSPGCGATAMWPKQGQKLR